MSNVVTITKLNAAGQAKMSYRGQIVFRDEHVVVARCPWPSDSTVDLGPFQMGPGDVFMEYYYAYEPFNIFAIYDALGVLKGWYCNVTQAVELADGVIRWHDLALDLLVLPDGRDLLLDEDEFEELQPSPALRRRAEEAIATLRRWVAERRGPFARPPA